MVILTLLSLELSVNVRFASRNAVITAKIVVMETISYLFAALLGPKLETKKMSPTSYRQI